MDFPFTVQQSFTLNEKQVKDLVTQYFYEKGYKVKSINVNISKEVDDYNGRYSSAVFNNLVVEVEPIK